jgi:hypothetical protein
VRPPSIIDFERAYLASLALGIVNTTIHWQAIEQSFEDPALQVLGGPGAIVGILAFGMAISLLLWFFIARRASTVAKWIYVVFIAFGVVGIISNLATLPLGTQLILNVVAQLLQLFAAWLLFKPDARAWFAGQWTADARVFD